MKCSPGCTCGRHRVRTPDQESRRKRAFYAAIAAHSQEKKADRYKRAAEGTRRFWSTASPEAKALRSEAMSSAKQDMTPEKREAWTSSLSEHGKKQWSDLSPEEYAVVIQKLKDKPPVSKRAKEALSTRSKAYWEKLSDDQRTAYVSRRLKGRNRIEVVVEGETIKVDSGWEPGAFAAMTRLGFSFRFAGRERTTLLLSSKGETWTPDFIIDDLNLIVDVKGSPHAWKRFRDHISPRLISVPHDVALIDFSCRADQFSSKEAFLSSLLWVKTSETSRPFVRRSYQNGV